MCIKLSPGIFFKHNTIATRLLYLVQAQIVHTTVELSARRSSVFNATFLLNGSYERQQSYRINAVGCWFKSEQCVGAFRAAESNHTMSYISIGSININGAGSDAKRASVFKLFEL